MREIIFSGTPHCLEGVLIIYEVDVEGGGVGRLHSSDCSTMMRKLAIWSAQDLFRRKLA